MNTWPSGVFRPNVSELRDRIAELERELETERMRLAACGVVALSDTPESAARERDMHPDYHSASLDDVIARVDECMDLRRQRDDLRTALVQAREDMIGWAAYADEYFRDKHNLAGDLAAIDAALEKSQ